MMKISKKNNKDDYPYWSKILPSPNIMFDNIKNAKLNIREGILYRSYPEDYINADGLSNYYTENIRKTCRFSDNLTPEEGWNKIKDKIRDLPIFEQKEEIYHITRECNIFNPTLVKWIISSTVGENALVLDPSSGWGDRLIGSLAAGAKLYHGFDPNSGLQKGYKEIIHDFGNSKYDIYNVSELPFEESNILDDYYDIAITSPPYFSIEQYKDSSSEKQKNQSIDRYPEYKEWVNNMYIPYVTKMVNGVKPDGWIIIYIENIKVGDTVYELRDLTNDLMDQLNVRKARNFRFATVVEGSKPKVRMALGWRKNK